MDEKLLLFYSIWNKENSTSKNRIWIDDLLFITRHNIKISSSSSYALKFNILLLIMFFCPIIWIPALFIWVYFDYTKLNDKDAKKLSTINTGIRLYNQENYAEALAIFEDISNLISKKDTTFNSWVYQCYLYTHQYEKALDFLQNHHFKNKRIKKLQCYLIRQDFEAMLHTIKKQYLFFEINYNPAILSIICSILLKLNRPTEAKKRLVKYHIDVNNFSEEMCAYLYTLGKCEEALGNMLEAQKAYKTILALNPNFMDINELVKI